MKIYYSKSTNGFYIDGVHKTTPDDVVEITQEQHNELLEGQSNGRVISADESGKPVLVEPPQPTVEQLVDQACAVRDAKLIATNWLVERHREEQESGTTTLTVQEYSDLLAYRQALRDVPQQEGFPFDVEWPEIPW